MQDRRYYNLNAQGRSAGSILIPLLILVGVLMVGYYLIKGLLSILAVLSPILLIATLIIDREVVWDYGRFIGRLLRENTLMGILGVILTAVGYPVVVGFLFGRAMLRRSLTKATAAARERRDGQLVDYEEVADEDEFLELPTTPKAKQAQSRRSSDTTDYEELFD